MRTSHVEYFFAMRRGTIAADCAHGFAHVTFCPNRGYGWTGVQTGSGPHRNACEKCAKLQHHPPREKERAGDRRRCQTHGDDGPPFQSAEASYPSPAAADGDAKTQSVCGIEGSFAGAWRQP
jgi:hypothetical protein